MTARRLLLALLLLKALLVYAPVSAAEPVPPARYYELVGDTTEPMPGRYACHVDGTPLPVIEIVGRYYVITGRPWGVRCLLDTTRGKHMPILALDVDEDAAFIYMYTYSYAVRLPVIAAGLHH